MRLEAPIIFEGLTALSVEIITNEDTEFWIDKVAKLNGGVAGYLMAWNYFTGGTASTELNEGDPVSAIDSSNGYGE